jgi:hypothetical protein
MRIRNTTTLGGTSPHQAVSHMRGGYVRENVHTNNIGSFWSEPLEAWRDRHLPQCQQRVFAALLE